MVRFLIFHLVDVIQSADSFSEVGHEMRRVRHGLRFIPQLFGNCATSDGRRNGSPPVGFSPGYYLRLAFNIVRWDDNAIRRASRDSNAIYYGAFLWIVAATIVLIGTALPQMLAAIHVSGPAMVIAVIVGMCVGLAVVAILTFIQLGLCHLIAKWFFGGTGSYLGVMRPLLLGWFVNCLVLIPVAGTLAAAIGWTAVLMMVFEEVEGISRLQAFGISAGINVCFFVLQQMMTPVTRHL